MAKKKKVEDEVKEVITDNDNNTSDFTDYIQLCEVVEKLRQWAKESGCRYF